MSRVVHRNASIERVETVIRVTNARAVARGGDVAAAAAVRLTPVLAVMLAGQGVLDVAKAALEAATGVWIAADLAARAAVGATLDAMWNALGRPRQHAAFDAVFPGGIALYTDAPREQRPTVLRAIAARITAATDARWPEALRTTWAAALDAVHGPLVSATSSMDDAEGAFRVATTSHDTAVRSTALRNLVAFKRDLKTLGMTEAQVGEIIPDAPRPTPAAPPLAPVAPPAGSIAASAPVQLPPMSAGAGPSASPAVGASAAPAPAPGPNGDAGAGAVAS